MAFDGSSRNNDLSEEYLRTVLNYDPITGLFAWRYRNDRSRSWNTQRAGKVAGTSDGHGYRIICINNRFYKAHRLAWLYMTGAWPPHDIDHKNLDGSDNRFLNLRLADQYENRFNTRKLATNTSGFKGVSKCRYTGLWEVRIRYYGRREYVGRFKAVELAHQAYAEAAQRLHGEFARVA